MPISQELLREVVSKLNPYFPTKTELDRALADIAKRVGRRAESNTWSPEASISRALRGLQAMQGRVINRVTSDEDVNFVRRALETGTVSGSYLVPTIQADEIIGMLSDAGVARRAGVRVWPMAGREKLTVPASLTCPTVEWLGENTAQTASDPGFGQLAFDLRSSRALVAVPNELIQSSSPQVDALLVEVLGVAFATAEDAAMFGTTDTANGPADLLSLLCS